LHRNLRVQPGAGPPPVRTLVFDLLDHLGVPTETGTEREVAIVLLAGDPSQIDLTLAPLAYRLQNHPAGLDRLSRAPQRADDHVGAASGDHRVSGAGGAFRALEKAVDDLVDGTVTA